MQFDLDFSDLQPIEKPFSYNGSDYVLKEATGEVAKKYRNEQMERLTLSSKGEVISTRDIGDLEPILVSLCVFTADGESVPQSEVEKWPSRMVTKLHDAAKTISGLDEESSSMKQLLEGLESDPSAPTTKEELREWVSKLNPSSYKDLIKEVHQLTEEDEKE